jgi:hypothetical protein
MYIRIDNMGANSIAPGFREIPTLLRGEIRPIQHWVEEWNTRRVLLYVTVIMLGTGLYGAAMGWWRSPLQALYTALKLPLVILLTTLGNALLNGMLAPLLGLNISFRQSLSLVLLSFTIAAAILGSFSPQALFIIWNTPITGTSSASALAYNFMQLTHVALIAFAGGLVAGYHFLFSGAVFLFQDAYVTARFGGADVGRNLSCKSLVVTADIPRSLISKATAG